MNTKGYAEIIKLLNPNWAALASSINRALEILDDKKDPARRITATSESLGALEAALTLNDGSSAEGVYRGVQFIPDGVLTDGDFVVAGRSLEILIICNPWHPYWVEEAQASARLGYDDDDPDAVPPPSDDEDED